MRKGVEAEGTGEHDELCPPKGSEYGDHEVLMKLQAQKHPDSGER